MNFGKIKTELYSTRGTLAVNQDTLLLEGDLIQQTGEAAEVRHRNHLVDGELYVCAVADGVSASTHGEVASFKALEELNQWFQDHRDNRWSDPKMPIQELVMQGIRRANDALIYYSREEGATYATTVTLLLIYAERYWILNAGDSPAFLLRDGTIQEIGERHNLGAAKLRQGEPAAVSDHSRLTLCLGGTSTDKLMKKLYISTGECQKGDIFLLCSDGLTEAVSEEQLAEVLPVQEDKYFTSSLKEILRKNPPDDNCSMIRIELLRADTNLMLDTADEMESKSQLMRLYSESHTKFLLWKDMIREMSAFDLKECSARISHDWGHGKDTAIKWLTNTPSRNNVLKICWSLNFDLAETERALTHYAPYSSLDLADPDDLVWHNLFQADRETVNDKGGPMLFLESEAANITINSGELCRWQLLKAVIDNRRKFKSDKKSFDNIFRYGSELNVNSKNRAGEETGSSWNSKKAVNKVNSELEGRPTSGQKMSRYFLIALALKEERSLELLNEDLRMNGMADLGRKSIFEITLRSVIEDIRVNSPNWYRDQMKDSREFGLHALDKTEIDDLKPELEKEVIKRLDYAREHIKEQEYRDDFDADFAELMKYL